MNKLRQVVLRISLLALLLAGCSGEPETGPGKVRWDRDTCIRCAMAVSDHNYSAQVRSRADGKNKVYKFDDIGCVVIWLQDKPWKDDPATEIWVTDHRNGEWIDARTAHYVTGKITPMAYGLGALPDASEGTLDYAAAKAHIFEVEEKFNIHATGDEHPNAAEK